MNDISIAVEGIAEPAWLDSVGRFAAKVLARLALDDWDLSILVCDDDCIARLNSTYRHKEGSTDVLSFSQGEWYSIGNSRRYLAGDVVLSIDAVQSNAREFNVPVDEELRRLLVHGILHLADRDHDSNDVIEPMLVEQESIMEALAEERIF